MAHSVRRKTEVHGNFSDQGAREGEHEQMKKSTSEGNVGKQVQHARVEY